MKRFTFISASVMAFATLAFAAQEGTLLRRKITAGSTETYRIETKTAQTIELPGMGEQEQSTETVNTYRFKIGEFDEAKKTYPIEVTMTLDKLTGGGPMGAAAESMIGKPTTLKGRIDERARVQMDAAPAAGNAGLSAMMGSGTGPGAVMVELPEKAIKVGESWEIIVPKSPFLQDKEQKLTATLVGEKEVDGVTGWVIKTTGNLTMDADLSKAMANQPNNPAAGQKMMIKGTVGVETDSVIEKATGRTIRMTQKARPTMNVEMVDMGMTVKITGLSTTTITRVADTK